MMSEAEAPLVVRSFPMLITFLSIFCSMVERSATMVTSSRLAISDSKGIEPILTNLLPELISIDLEYVLYPINCTCKVYVPSGISLMIKLPSSWELFPETNLPSESLINTVA